MYAVVNKLDKRSELCQMLILLFDKCLSIGHGKHGINSTIGGTILSTTIQDNDVGVS